MYMQRDFLLCVAVVTAAAMRSCARACLQTSPQTSAWWPASGAPTQRSTQKSFRRKSLNFTPSPQNNLAAEASNGDWARYNTGRPLHDMTTIAGIWLVGLSVGAAPFRQRACSCMTGFVQAFG